MKNPIIITHARGAPGLRFFGIGAYFKPTQGVQKLLKLLTDNSSWASNRSQRDIKTMLEKSSVVVSAWNYNKMIGFGRAHSDKIFRAILWDVIVAHDMQGKGIGKLIVESLIQSKDIKDVEKVYLMTTNCKEFYSQIGFKISKNQTLLTLKK